MAQFVEAIRTSRQDAGSIPDVVIWIFWGLSSSALGSAQPVAEMSTREGQRCRYVGLTVLITCADGIEILGASASWILMDLLRPALGWLYSLHTTNRMKAD